jgi:hypothetical protein
LRVFLKKCFFVAHLLIVHCVHCGPILWVWGGGMKILLSFGPTFGLCGKTPSNCAAVGRVVRQRVLFPTFLQVFGTSFLLTRYFAYWKSRSLSQLFVCSELGELYSKPISWRLWVLSAYESKNVWIALLDLSRIDSESIRQKQT